MENEKVIGVTGAAGFGGRHLVERLKAENYFVRTLIRDVSKEIKDTESIVGDLETGENLDQFLDGIGTVVNLVGRFQSPFKDQLIGNAATLDNLCSVAVKNGVKKIIHVSALAVDGLPEEGHLFTEADTPKPDTSYALVKRLAEEVAQYYHNNFDLSIVILRPPNVYGPGSDHGAVYNLIKSAKESGGVTIHGDGTQQRDFLYVGDLVEAIVKSIGYQSSFDVFNITTADPKSLSELAGAIGKVMKIDLKVTHEGEAQGAKVVAGDNSKAKKVLNWVPKTSLIEGLSLTLNV